MRPSAWKASTFTFLGVSLLLFAWYFWTPSFNLLHTVPSFAYKVLEPPELKGPAISATQIGTPKDSSSVTPPPTNCTDAEVKKRLKKAEANWKRSHVRRKAVLKRIHITDDLERTETRIWDFFYPNFDCPYTKERIGRVGDGGKWICGFDLLVSKVKCTVFSFGIQDETSFEEEFLRRTKYCVLHMFDPTITSVPSLVDRYPDRAFLHFQGIGSGTEDEPEFGTLEAIMAELDVTELDVLKMDVEGAEWNAMRRIVQDFPQKLPFAQLQVEVHLDKFQNSTEWLRILGSWYRNLELAGLRQFFQEPNLLWTPFMFRELAFLNIKVDPFKLK